MPTITVPDHEWNKLREGIEVLCGWRKGNTQGKALTQADQKALDRSIKELSQLVENAAKTEPVTLQSADAAAAAPTAAEYNKLVADVKALSEQINTLINTLKA